MTPKKRILIKGKAWNTCSECGDKFYKRTKEWKAEHMAGITCTAGTCPDCGKENVVLIPHSDYRGVWD
jgi:hypothetical protein